jgi:hypothetical protein
MSGILPMPGALDSTAAQEASDSQERSTSAADTSTRNVLCHGDVTMLSVVAIHCDRTNAAGGRKTEFGSLTLSQWSIISFQGLFPTKSAQMIRNRNQTHRQDHYSKPRSVQQYNLMPSSYKSQRSNECKSSLAENT